MGCGNSKAQKDTAVSPSSAGRTENPLPDSAATAQHQQQQYQQQQQHQQEQQQYSQQQYQKQQSQAPAAATESKREDSGNKSHNTSTDMYQNQQQSPAKINSPSPVKNSQLSAGVSHDNSPQSYRKENYPQTFNRQQMYEEQAPAYAEQQLAHPTNRSNQSFEKSQRLQTPQIAEHPKEVAVAENHTDPKVMKIPRDDSGTPHILFSFDFVNKDFNFYNFKKDQWDLNNLGRSTDDCPKCPLFKYKVPGEEAEGLQFAKYMSYIALSDEVIFIIGGYNSYYSCLEYNIISNKFYAREPLKSFRNNPSLCRYGQYIYAVSGDLLDKFSTDVARYDTQRNEWVTLPDLPSPQGFASVAVVNGVKGAQPSDKTLKLIALGGLSQKFPKTHTSLLSLFSFDEQRWNSFDLSRFIDQKIPKFVHSPIAQTKEGDIIIFGTEGSRSVYNFDVFNIKLATAGRLPNDEAFNESMKSKEAFYYNEKIYCLAYKLNLKVYRGSLTTNKWEVI